MAPLLDVFGSGPGIGISTAKLFAQKHFDNVVLLARNAERLEKEKLEVELAGKQCGRTIQVNTFATDLCNFDQLSKTLIEIEKLGEMECIFFNAAKIQPSEILKTSVEEIEEDFRTTNLALYIIAQWAIPLLQKPEAASPTFVVTNSALPEQPMPFLLSLSAVKASQQNIVHSLRAAFGKEIHIGLVKVAGQVSPEEKNLNPVKIAGEIVGFYEKGRGEWDVDVVLNP